MVAVILGFNSMVYAQSQSVQVEYQKVLRPALVNEIPFGVKTIENAIEESFSKMGYKKSSSKGFDVFKGVHLTQLGPDPYDLYFMVDKKSRRDKENSTVTMMISKGFDEFVSQASDEALFTKSKNYLDSIRNMIASYDLEQQISAQEDEVKAADKKNTDLQDESVDLEKKKRKLDDQISKNMKEQQNQVKELEKQRQILDVLKSKRKQ